MFDPLFPNAQKPDVTPIDVSTILSDLDGTLTGVTVVQPDCTTPVRSRTSSVSVNDFFNAPTQSPSMCRIRGAKPGRMILVHH